MRPDSMKVSLTRGDQAWSAKKERIKDFKIEIRPILGDVFNRRENQILRGGAWCKVDLNQSIL